MRSTGSSGAGAPDAGMEVRPVLRAHLVVAVRLPEVRQRDREEAAALRRYYLPMRPPQIGAYPKGAKKVVALGERRRVEGCAPPRLGLGRVRGGPDAPSRSTTTS